MPHNGAMGGSRRPQSAGGARPRSKPSWDSTTSDLDQLRLSKDDLRLKLQSRQHKPLTEYKGPVNIVKKTRPDGTEYVVGVTHPVPVKPVADLRDTLKARGGGKENAPCAEEESQAANAALSAAAEAYMEVMRIPAMSTTIAAPGADAYFVDAPAPALPAPAHAAAPDVPAFLAASATPSGAEDAAHHLPSQASPPHAGLGRAVRQPISRRAPPAVEREVELANLSDACEELRCRIVKYEHSTGRPDAPGLFRRPVQQGFTEFLFRASERAFEYLGESDRAREALERRVDAAEEVSSQALLLIAEMREELHAAKQALSRQQETEEQRVGEKMQHVEAQNKELAKQVASLSRSLEFHSVSSILESALSLPATRPAPAPHPHPTPNEDTPAEPAPVPHRHVVSFSPDLSALPQGMLSPVEESPRGQDVAQVMMLQASVVVGGGNGRPSAGHRLAPGKLVQQRQRPGAQV